MQRQNKISSVLIVFVTLLALTIGSVASPVPVYAVSTITVNTSADHTPTDGFCSLREAIHNANYDAAIYRDCAAGSGNDFIVFDPSVFPDFASSPKIVLLKTLQIRDTDGLTIDGGAAYVTISGNSQVRVFTVNSGASLTLKNLRVYEGSEDSGGGAVLNYGRLTIDHSSFVGNRAGAGPGGAIYSIGSLVIVYGIFLSNSSSSPSPSQGGGAIYHDYDSDLLVARSSFAGNRAAYGAAININRGTGHRITESAFMDNDGVSGAILNRGFTEISNSTFTGNDATDIGGAIYNLQNMIVINNTFSGNSAVVPRGGGDIYQLGSGSQLILLNNIFANSRGGGHCGAVHGRVTSHSNLIEDAVLTCGLTNGVNGNIIGSDPALGPLTGYIVFDFPPPYFPLKSGSRAIDAGYDLVCPATDQRGVTRPQGSHCDIGAYEYP